MSENKKMKKCRGECERPRLRKELDRCRRNQSEIVDVTEYDIRIRMLEQQCAEMASALRGLIPIPIGDHVVPHSFQMVIRASEVNNAIAALRRHEEEERRLDEAGWQTGDFADFLKLSPQEAWYIKAAYKRREEEGK
jgi:hypothetical protein